MKTTTLQYITSGELYNEISGKNNISTKLEDISNLAYKVVSDGVKNVGEELIKFLKAHKIKVNDDNIITLKKLGIPRDTSDRDRLIELMRDTYYFIHSKVTQLRDPQLYAQDTNCKKAYIYYLEKESELCKIILHFADEHLFKSIISQNDI